MSIPQWKNPMLPLLKTFRILGRTPFTIDQFSGDLECRLASPASAWALLSTAVQAVMAFKVHIWDMLKKAKWSSFDSALEVFMKIFFFDGVVHSIAITWWATPAVTRAYNAWNRFHAVLEEKTNRQVTTGLLDRSGTGVVVIGAVIWPLMIIPFSLVSRVSSYDSDDYENITISALVYFFSLFYFLIVLWQWIIFCAMTERAACIIQESLIQSDHGNRERCISDARMLWLELRSCSVAFSQATARAMALWLLELLYDYVVILYEVVTFALDPYDIDVYAVAIVLMADTITTFMTFFFSSWASNGIHDRVLEALFAENWTSLSESEYSEMNLLTNAVEVGNPCFEILGIFTLDKFQYISILETIVTYLVVLVQFYQLSPEEDTTEKSV